MGKEKETFEVWSSQKQRKKAMTRGNAAKDAPSSTANMAGKLSRKNNASPSRRGMKSTMVSAKEHPGSIQLFSKGRETDREGKRLEKQPGPMNMPVKKKRHKDWRSKTWSQCFLTRVQCEQLSRTMVI